MTYEYLCSACGHEWEAEQSINDQPLKKCPKCKKARAKRQVSGGAGFLLKGGGWYADGYGSSAPNKKAGDAAAPEKASDTTASSSKDGTTASKESKKADKSGKTAA